MSKQAKLVIKINNKDKTIEGKMRSSKKDTETLIRGTLAVLERNLRELDIDHEEFKILINVLIDQNRKVLEV